MNTNETCTDSNYGIELREEIREVFYNGGLNCAETTMLLLIKHGIIDVDINLQKMMSGFGGGMQKGLVCGAVTASVAAIGMKTGRLKSGESREPSANAVKEFLKNFEEQFSELMCNELIKDYESKSTEMYNHCINYIAISVELTEQLLCSI